MTTPAEARSSVTGQQQTAFDRERVVEPERQEPGVAETSPGEQAGSADGGQPVFDRVVRLERQLAAERAARAKRERQLEQEQQQRQQAEAKLAHQRERERVRQQRRRERNPEQMRKQHTEYMREWRARQREQGSSATGQQQPVLDRFAEREGQLPGVQQAQVKPERRDLEAADKQERRRAQNAASKRRYRERRGDEGKRQEIRYKREWRARQREQGSSATGQQQPVFGQVSELERLRAQTRQEQARLDHQRKLKAAAQQRRRQNLGDQGRAHHAEYMREWRARRRQQGSR